MRGHVFRQPPQGGLHKIRRRAAGQGQAQLLHGVENFHVFRVERGKIDRAHVFSVVGPHGLAPYVGLF